MSDTTQSHAEPSPQAVPDVPPKSTRFLKYKIMFGMVPEPTGRPSFIWLERKDAIIVAAFIAIGLPLLGFSGFSYFTKWVIFGLWMMLWSPFFSSFESRELIGQMMGRGAIKQEQLSEQQNTAQNPFYGVFIAVFIYIAAFMVQMALRLVAVYDGSILETFAVHLWIELWNWLWHGTWQPWINYQITEWIILVHAWIVTGLINYYTYNTGNTFSKILLQEKIERQMPLQQS